MFSNLGRMSKTLGNQLNKWGDFSHLLKSRVILYFFFFLSLGNLYSFTSNGDYLFATIFILVGFLTSFFSKNMIVILCIALTITNVLKYGKGMRLEEGMKSDKDDKDDKDDTDDTDDNKETTNPSTDSKNNTLNGDTSTKKKDFLNADLGNASNESNLTDIKQKSDELTGVNPDKNMEAHYKSLIELQGKLLDGITKMQPVLEQAKKTVEKMTNANK